MVFAKELADYISKVSEAVTWGKEIYAEFQMYWVSYPSINIQILWVKSVTDLPGFVQDPGAEFKMLVADRVVQRIYPARDSLDALTARRTINDLGKGGLCSRCGQDIEECASEDIAMLLAQVIDCQFSGLRILVGRWC